MKILRRHRWLIRAMTRLIAAVSIPLALNTGVAAANIPGCLSTDIVGVAASATGAGYWLIEVDGGVFFLGGAPNYGSMGGKQLARPVSGIAMTISRMHQLTSPQSGDLAFYGVSTSRTTHVGIYIGNGQMIGALHTNTAVEMDSVKVESDLLGYWRYS